MLEKSDKNVEYLVVDTTAFIENAPLQTYNPQLITSNWTSITSEFFQSVTCLKLGELLHVDSFTLADAMTAVEMMDPKLDLGMKANRKKLLASFEKAAAAGILKLKDFTETELVGTMDLILASFALNMGGTLETNLYLQKPEGILDKTLKIYCMCLQEILRIVKELVERAAVFDEDFQLLHCEYSCNVDITEEELIGNLTEQEHHTSNVLSCRIAFVRILYQSLISLLEEHPVLPPQFENLVAIALKHLVLIKQTHQEDFMLEVFIELNLKPKAAFEYLDTLLKNFKPISKITEIKEYDAALKIFQQFSKTNPCIVSRSVLQLLYPGSNIMIMKSNPYQLHELLRVDSHIFVGNSTQKTKFYIDTFLSLAIAPFGSLLKLSGFNQTRQRDKISLILQEFVVLQTEALKVDETIECYSKQFVSSFSTWILYHTLKAMVLYLYKGFELELYSVHEYYYIYWYLSEYLYSWLKTALKKTNIFGDLSDTPRNKKHVKKVKNETQIVKVHQEMIYFHAVQNLCAGYYQTILGLMVDKKIRMPFSEFNSEEIRYNHRFEPFVNLGIPPYVEYKNFLKTASYSLTKDSRVLYEEGLTHFSSARQLLEALDASNDEKAALIKISKTNCVVLKLMIDGYKKQSAALPEFNFALHKCFPIVKFS